MEERRAILELMVDVAAVVVTSEYTWVEREYRDSREVRVPVPCILLAAEEVLEAAV